MIIVKYYNTSSIRLYINSQIIYKTKHRVGENRLSLECCIIITMLLLIFVFNDDIIVRQLHQYKLYCSPEYNYKFIM